MQDIKRLQNALLEDPSDQEALELLRKEAKRKGDKDLKIFCMIFNSSFCEIKRYLKTKGIPVFSYFTSKEWEILHKRFPIMEVEDREDLPYSNSFHFTPSTFRNLQDQGVYPIQDKSRVKSLSFYSVILDNFDSREYPNLESLSISSCRLRGKIDLSNPSIKKLDFIFANIDSPPEKLTLSNNLQHLEVQVDPSRIYPCYKLESLQECRDLKYVSVQDAPIDLGFLKFNENIEELGLINCGITDFEYKNANKLESLNLGNNSVTHIRGNFPKLVCIDFIPDLSGRLTVEGDFPNLPDFKETYIRLRRFGKKF